jgi:hypothetical protein
VRTRFRIVVASFLVVAGLLALTGAAFAGTITTPSTNPFAVPGDSTGNPQPFTVVGSGFAPNTNIFAIICDGTPSTTPGWDPTLNCDNLTAPAPVASSSTGVATFSATDPNAAIHPFKGASPNLMFNCIAPGDAQPTNGLPTFTNCQVRISSNNASSTSDQTFLTMTLPATVTPPPATPETKYVVLLPVAALMAIGGFVLYRRRSHATV